MVSGCREERKNKTKIAEVGGKGLRHKQTEMETDTGARERKRKTSGRLEKNSFLCLGERTAEPESTSWSWLSSAFG